MIAYIINDLAVRGGTHKQLLMLLDYTAQQGEDFIVVARQVDLGNTFPGFSRHRERIRLFEPLPERGLKRLSRHRRNIARLKEIIAGADVVNLHDYGYDRWLEAFADIPTVWQINDLPAPFRQGVSAKADSLRMWWKRRAICRGMRGIDAVTVNVSKNAGRVARCMGREARVLYCGIEPLGIRADREASQARMHARRLHLLSSGVWLPYRNYESLVQAVALLRQRGWDVHLDIIGSTAFDPAYVARIRSLIAGLSPGQAVTVHGMVDEETFAALHSQADMFLFVNVDQSWGLAVFEAMSAGLPVIVSRSVGATELLHDGLDSLWVEPRDPQAIAAAVERLASDPQMYAAISERAARFHERYTWQEAYCRPMLDIIHSLAAGSTQY